MKNWKRICVTALVVALSSQIYWNLFSNGFRISIAVILLPVLLMTIVQNVSTLKTCFITACVVFFFRSALGLYDGKTLMQTCLLYLPNAAFYLCYGLLFQLCIPYKHRLPRLQIISFLFCCDFISNMTELCISRILNPASRPDVLENIIYLALIALIRAFFAECILLGENRYRILLTREEHENRYRRLFLMTSSLKNEIYFMKKNSEEIESIMGSAYRLYEQLSLMDVSDEIKNTSLSIAMNVHEIKKDYIRIIQGIEKEIAEKYDDEKMSLKDILQILESSTYDLLENKKIPITLEFRCHTDFVTEHHFELMAILRNLVNNSIEAIETTHKPGTIRINEIREDDFYVFDVSDDGPGIAPRNLAHIFDIGFSTKFDYQTGNIYRGVGLYGVKTVLMETFSTTISVDSRQGEGTSFHFRIPVNLPSEEDLL